MMEERKGNWALVADNLAKPFDEGFKNITLQLASTLSSKFGVVPFLEYAVDILPEARVLPLGDRLPSYRLLRALKSFQPRVLLYIPSSSFTWGSFVRASLMRVVMPSTVVVVVALQAREWNSRAKFFGRLWPLAGLVALSKRMAEEMSGTCRWREVLAPGIDTVKFAPVTSEQKLILRRQYGIGEKDFIVLHAGHVKESRNLEELATAATRAKGRLLLLCSGTTREETDPALLSRLHGLGVVIVEGTQERIQDYYNLSDCYGFAVRQRTGATEMPLSVFEAMASNLKIVTASYGNLPDIFAHNPAAGFWFADDLEGMVTGLVTLRQQGEAQTRALVESFGWEHCAHELMARLTERIEGERG